MLLLRQNPFRSLLLACILILHLAFVIILFIAPTFDTPKKKHKPLIVKMVSVQPHLKTLALEKKPSAFSSNVSPAQKQVEKPKPVAQKQQASKTVTPQPQISKKSAPATIVKKESAIADKTLKPASPITKKNPPETPLPRAKISDSLIKELEESIAKLETKNVPSSAAKTKGRATQAIAPIALQIDSITADDLSLDNGSNHYTDLLVSHLYQSLQLPEFGEVKIQLSLCQDGTIAKLVVLYSQSEKNRLYLEKNLPSLKFPRFEGIYSTKKNHTFTLTFCNKL